MTNKTIKAKLIFVLAFSIFGMLAVSAFTLTSERSALLEDRKIKTRHIVESASGVLDYFYAAHKGGALSEEDAKAAALSVLKGMRYGDNDYLWVNDQYPRVVMHPIKPELDGKDVSGTKDADGRLLFVEFVKVVTSSGAGYVDYLWPKPGKDKAVPKTSYVRGFMPWGWVLGSGIYIDDVESAFWARAGQLGGFLLVITGATALVLFLITRNITRTIARIKTAMQRIHETGDLAQRVDTQSGGEIAEIAEAFNVLVSGFQTLIRDVIATSHKVLTLTSQLAASANTVANGSQQQSDASASMAAALEETKASIEQVAANSRAAHAIATEAGARSRDGRETVGSAATEIRQIAGAVQTSAQYIDELGSHSARISSIVNVIREIADQTNLLALNAAIEAARAGEQGRGFAVVADEVRKLAERTSHSTQEIGEMIGMIQNGTAEAVRGMKEGSARVQHGVELANSAGTSMTEIQDSVLRVLDVVTEVMQAITEQNAAADTIVSSVEHVVTMAEQNSAETSAIADSARQLEGLAQRLQQTVDQFKV